MALPIPFHFFLCPVISEVTTPSCPIKCQVILDSSIVTCPTTAEYLIIPIAGCHGCCLLLSQPSVLLPHRFANLVYIYHTLELCCPENDPLLVLQSLRRGHFPPTRFQTIAHQLCLLNDPAHSILQHLQSPLADQTKSTIIAEWGRM